MLIHVLLDRAVYSKILCNVPHLESVCLNQVLAYVWLPKLA